MRLVLHDGVVFSGESFSARRRAKGEVVFNTGLTGYVESLTDPSYHGQILVLTYPLQGNYGVPQGPFESGRIQVRGLVIAAHSDERSHHAAVRTLGDWLRDGDIPAIQGVDTRTLTRHLREEGTMNGFLAEEGDEFAPNDPSLAETETAHAVSFVASSQIVRVEGGEPRILVIDTGAKENILRSLQARGATLIRAPYHADWERLLDDVDGVVLTNGPGDPYGLLPLVARIRGILARGLPTFGICLGHQLLALAAGAKRYKMKYGHRSQNQPVQDMISLRAYVTSQNHGFAVDAESLPPDWEPWFRNLNDGSNEGLRHGYRPFRSVQFHPEGAPGPLDTAYLFDDFIRMVMQMKRARPA